MAPRTGRSKAHNARSEKKKKEAKIPPVVLEIAVNIPNDSQIILKVRGNRLRDTWEVMTLKPCVLTIIEEDYEEQQATEHIQRFSDIVACTMCFGPSRNQGKSWSGQGNSKESIHSIDNSSIESKQTKTGRKVEAEGNVGVDNKDKKANETKRSPESCHGKEIYKSAAAVAMTSRAKETMEKEDNPGTHPQLGQFYEFFSLSHILSPVQYIRKSTKPLAEEKQSKRDFFTIDVRISASLKHLSCEALQWKVDDSHSMHQRFLQCWKAACAKPYSNQFATTVE
eukprot:Gb_20704 [translate_table: standard]